MTITTELHSRGSNRPQSGFVERIFLDASFVLTVAERGRFTRRLLEGTSSLPAS